MFLGTINRALPLLLYTLEYLKTKRTLAVYFASPTPFFFLFLSLFRSIYIIWKILSAPLFHSLPTSRFRLIFQHLLPTGFRLSLSLSLCCMVSNGFVAEQLEVFTLLLHGRDFYVVVVIVVVVVQY